jgi:dipeptidyl aminopeptidase/acylaminoacyl peptidase
MSEHTPQSRTVAPFGSWSSPISASYLAQQGVSMGGARPLPDGGVVWRETRPAQGGRVVMVRMDREGNVRDLTPEGFDVKTRVHEYGGAPSAVSGTTLFFSNFSDQRVYRAPLEGGAEPEPITPEPPAPAAHRYADLCPTPDGRFLICVRERHDGDEVVNDLVAIPTDGSAPPHAIAGGNDFYSSPAIDPAGRRLAWLTWNHPLMPWDGTELWVGDLGEDATVSGARRVAGGTDESVFQPIWSPDGVLYFVSDRTGWWNVYRARDGRVEPLTSMEAEFGQAQWVFGLSTLAFVDERRLACVRSQDGVHHLGILDTESGRLTDLELPYTVFHATLRSLGPRLLVQVAGPTQPNTLIEVDADTGSHRILRRPSELALDPDDISVARAIEFPTAGGRTAYAFFYPPANRRFEGRAGERPPLLVWSHGGPTDDVHPGLSLPHQFWTTRGFAVVDVNYGGSTGHGRAYRECLKGNWGIVDVEDCVNAARYLADQGEVDGERLIIQGGSAGGFTTLCALTFTDVFAVGASYFGVGDLERLRADTHKFESRYLDGLVGPYPETVQTYHQRSPIHHVEQLSNPMILFQGLEDRVVPVSQAESMAEALRRKGIPFAYIAFPNEFHGFRNPANVIRSLEAELSFYGQILGFVPADPIEPVPIENLENLAAPARVAGSDA